MNWNIVGICIIWFDYCVRKRGLNVAFKMGCVFFLFFSMLSRLSRLQIKQIFHLKNKTPMHGCYDKD